jgi:diacylglycerol O-acyltransferase
VAAVVKIHHAMADGVAAANLLAHVMSESPGSADPLPADSWVPEPLPRRGELVRDALLDHVARVGRVPRLVGRTAAGLAAFGRRRRELGRAAPRPLVDTPRAPFNTSLTAERCFASADLSLAEVRRVKEAGGVTVNDVLLAVSAGTLRRWLEARGALLDRPLVAEVPVSADRSAALRLSGNRTSNLFAFLRTDLADPAERLKATHEATSAAKQLHEALGADMYGDWSEYAPPALYRFAMRQLAKHRIADRTRPPVNLIISNVRGPSAPLYWEGAPLRSIYSVGPILEGIGLNLTMWSYLDRVFVGALACPDRLDGLHEITQGLGAELDRLVAAIAPR